MRNRVYKYAAAAALALSTLANPVQAFDSDDAPVSQFINVSNFGATDPNCRISLGLQPDNDFAQVSIQYTPDTPVFSDIVSRVAGGAFWQTESSTPDTRSSPISAGDLAYCLGVPETAVVNLEQNGADNGSFANDNYIGFRFTLAEHGDVLLAGDYEYKVGRGTLENNALPNRPPVITSVDGPRTVQAGSTEFYTINATDADNDDLFYSWSNVAVGQTASFEFQPLPIGAPDQQVLLTAFASDGTEMVQQSFTVTIQAPQNKPPVISGISGPTTVEAGSTHIYTANATDADGDDLTYLWNTGDTTPSTQVTFPPLNVGDDDLSLTLTVSVDDGSTEDSEAINIIVLAPRDTTPPDAPSADTVTIARIDETKARISGTTEPNGLIELAYPTGLFTFSADGTGAFSETFPVTKEAGTASVNFQDASGNRTEIVTFEVPAFGPTVAEVQEEVQQLAQTRGAMLMAAQPDLIPLLTGTGMGAFNLQATQGNGTFDFATNGQRSVWAQIQGNWSTHDDVESSYVFGAFGGHMQLGPNAIAGVMLQFDQIEQDQGETATSGTGYLVGPYAVAKLPDQPLYFEARALFGQAENSVTLDGNEEEFTSTRTLASIKVAGDLEYGDLTLIPSLAATYYRDTQEAFSDSFDTEIPEQTLEMTDVAVGLDFARDYILDNGNLTLTGGVAYLNASVSGDGFDEDAISAFEGGRTRLSLGAAYAMDRGLKFSGRVNYDGLGDSDYESLGVNLGVQMSF